jgi:hypothetical protein
MGSSAPRARAPVGGHGCEVRDRALNSERRPGPRAHSVDLEYVSDVTQCSWLSIVRRPAPRIANDDGAVALVCDAYTPWASKAPLDVDLASTRTDEVAVAVLDELNLAHGTPPCRASDVRVAVGADRGRLLPIITFSTRASPEAKVPRPQDASADRAAT